MASAGCKGICKSYCIGLILTAPYPLRSSGEAERGVDLINEIMKRTEDEGTSFKEAFAAFKNARNS